MSTVYHLPAAQYHWVLHCGIITCLPVPLYVCVYVSGWTGIKTGSPKRILTWEVHISTLHLSLHSPFIIMLFSFTKPLPPFHYLALSFISLSITSSLLALILPLKPFSPLRRFLAVSVCLPASATFSLPILVVPTFFVAGKAIRVTFSCND